MAKISQPDLTGIDPLYAEAWHDHTWKRTRRTDTGQGETGLFKHEVSGNKWKQSGAGQTLTMAGKHTKGASNRA